MTTKVTVKVEDGASHAVRVTRLATTTGQEYEGRDVEAGKEESFTLEDEQRIDISRGAATPEDEAADADAETSTRKKK